MSDVKPKLFPDNVVETELHRTLKRRKTLDCELRRIRLERRNIANTRSYAIERWGVFREGNYLGYFRKIGSGFIFTESHGPSCPRYGETFIGEANADTTEYKVLREAGVETKTR